MATKSATKRGTKSAGKRAASKRSTDRPHATTQRSMSKAVQARYAAMNACSPVVTQGEIVNTIQAEGGELKRASVGLILNGDWYNADVVRVFCALTGTKKAHMWPEWIDERGNVREGVK